MWIWKFPPQPSIIPLLTTPAPCLTSLGVIFFHSHINTVAWSAFFHLQKKKEWSLPIPCTKQRRLHSFTPSSPPLLITVLVRFGLRLSLCKLQTSAEVCCCSTPIIARAPVPSSHYSCVESRNNEAFKSGIAVCVCVRAHFRVYAW